MKTEKDQIKITSPERHQFKSDNTFGQQAIDLHDTPLFFPKGFEKIFIAIYFTVLPYIVGLIFTFVYLAKSDYELFLSLHKETPFLLTWAIGYEIIATLLLLYIIKMAIEFSTTAAPKGPNKNFKRPT
jgi:hypothetical protein